jgi:hypothetical protein
VRLAGWKTTPCYASDTAGTALARLCPPYRLAHSGATRDIARHALTREAPMTLEAMLEALWALEQLEDVSALLNKLAT